jgi:hypothetical protein
MNPISVAYLPEAKPWNPPQSPVFALLAKWWMSPAISAALTSSGLGPPAPRPAAACELSTNPSPLFQLRPTRVQRIHNLLRLGHFRQDVL